MVLDFSPWQENDAEAVQANALKKE